MQGQRRSSAPGCTPLQSDAFASVADREGGSAVDGITGRYDQSDLIVYGAEDDEKMDSILDALERAPPARA
ncbi:hypothetical protein CHO01_38270 [Cellulomonas hominis]|uniref:Uncharacterized protein n=1 Tax=Cellulomonas hominis TaxID=156981 RepID=A0A511FHK4_9CELL|nr:hypothetical protein CHO01_38270 [Cellulomonas hominis]